MSGSASTRQLIPLDELVLHPALQCREEMLEVAVEDYATAMVEHFEAFPALGVVRVEGKGLLVVDGWHRLKAARRAVERLSYQWGKPEDKARAPALAAFPCDVVDGTWSDAIRAAAAANPGHGVRRSDADKRRAVRTLLMDAEHCGLSSRELAAIARVSHMLVQDQRKRYHLEDGELLTEERQSAVDGEAPPQWKALKAAYEHYYHGDIDRIRTAPTPVALAGLFEIGHTAGRAAHLLRMDELATEEWPWPEDISEAARERRRLSLDTVEDIARALSSMPYASLYEVLAKVPKIDKAREAWEWSALAKHFVGRPAFLARISARQAEVEKKAAKRAQSVEPTQSWEWHNKVSALKGDPVAQAEVVRKMPTNVLAYGAKSLGLTSSVRDGAYRERIGGRWGCSDPDCKGWVHPTSGACAWCHVTPADWRNGLESAGALWSRLLQRDGYALHVAGVQLDEATLDLLSSLQAVLSGGFASELVAAAPPELARRIRRWRERPAPVHVVGAPKVDEARPTAGNSSTQESAEDADSSTSEESPCAECGGTGHAEDGYACPDCQVACACNPAGDVPEPGNAVAGCDACNGRGEELLGWVPQGARKVALPELMAIGGGR